MMSGPFFFGNLLETLGILVATKSVDNPSNPVGKRFIKKNFFERAFAIYFAVLTAGKFLTKF
jgi:hypothetical protein